jgi:hypothetical protein
MTYAKYLYAFAGMAFFSMPAVSADGPAASVAEPRAGHARTPGPAIPSSIKAEHEKLHERLAGLLKSGGRTASAAADVEKSLQPHFVKEEQFALPPLGLLSGLASGKLPSDAASVIKMTDRLKAEMPQMLHEHKEIVVALENLRTAAQQEHRTDAVAFADDLIAHATQEEQILYPSAILVGEYLKLKR